MSKQETVTVRVEKVLPDGTAKRTKTTYHPNKSAIEYAKSTKSNYDNGLREGKLISIKINDKLYWGSDDDDKNPPSLEKPKSKPLY